MCAAAHPDTAADRRRHFRIEARARVEFQPLPGGDHGHLDTLFPPAPYFGLRRELHSLDEELERLLHRLAEQDRSTAAALRLLNRKLDQISQALCPTPTAPDPFPITLSEGGLSLITSAPLTPGTRLGLRVWLWPAGPALLVQARVIYSCAWEGGQRVGVEFFDLEARVRDTLARHLLAQQGRQRRHRAARESTP